MISKYICSQQNKKKILVALEKPVFLRWSRDQQEEFEFVRYFSGTTVALINLVALIRGERCRVQKDVIFGR